MCRWGVKSWWGGGGRLEGEGCKGNGVMDGFRL